jgi:hypothetical protein
MVIIIQVFWIHRNLVYGGSVYGVVRIWTIASNDRITDKLERIWKETAMA